MSTTFFILMIIAMLLVLASLFVGVGAMVKGGEFNKKYANKLMQARVLMQAIALGLFILAVITGKS